MPESKPNVFLSYSSKDKREVRRVAEDLRSEGISVWLDQDELRPGDIWHTQIEKALSEADYLLLFLSESSLRSEWVQREYRSAFSRMSAEGGTTIIPILLERVDLPPFLSQIQYVDLTESYFTGIRKLLHAIRGAKPSSRPSEIIDTRDLAKDVAGEVAKLLGLESLALPKAAATEVDPELVFVIISFHPDMDPVYEGIKAAAATVGLTAKRVKDVQGDYKINDVIVSMIAKARLIVADLSHERPNVYFELGYARGLGKTVVTTARESTNIHFDVKDWNYISYTDSRILERDLVSRFQFELNRPTES